MALAAIVLRFNGGSPLRRSIWRTRYLENGFPAFPCPRCSNGALRQVAGSFHKVYEPRRGDEPWDQGGAFSGLLQCSNGWCKETVSMGGWIESSYDYDQDGETFYVEYFYLRALTARVPVITLPQKMPKPVHETLRAAFTLLWSDHGACANKLRIAVEQILDHFEVPKRSEKGGRLSLQARLGLFSEKSEGHDLTFDALREVGNTGSHEGNVDFEALLDAFEILEPALEDVFTGKRARLAQLAQKLKVTKGKTGRTQRIAK